MEEEIATDAENNGDQSSGDQTVRRSRKAKKTVQPLPDPRLNVDKHVKILRAICAASDKGSKFVTSSEVAPLAGVHDTEAGGACSFFYKIGMLERENYAYKPKEAIVSFCNDLEWAPETASDALKDEFTNTWFGKLIIDYFKVNTESAKDDLIKNLGRVAQADSYHKRSLSTLIDFLNYVNIINYDESSKKYIIVNKIIPPRTQEPKPKELIGDISEKPENSINLPIKRDSQKSDTVETIVNINLDVKFSDDTDSKELAKKVREFRELIK